MKRTLKSRPQLHSVTRPVAALCLAAVLLLPAARTFASDVKVEYEDTLDEAQVTEATEVEIKAAFVLRFPDFVTWPEIPGDTLRIGVVRDDDMLGMLAFLAEQENRRRNGTSFTLEVVPVATSAAAARCQILIFGPTVETKVLAAVKPARPEGILTIGAWNEPREGAVIRLFREGEHVRFDISQDLAQAAGVRISSKLLNLARQQSERRTGVAPQ